MTTDRRLTPARPDVAAEYLRGQVEAERLAAPMACRVRDDEVGLRARPDCGAAFETMLLFGEPFDVYDRADGWAWGQSGLDGYVGYLSDRALEPAPAAPPTHMVRTLGGQLYPVPELKTPPTGTLPFAARVVVGDHREGYCQLDGGLWMPAQQLRPMGEPEPDWVAVAERFAGVPYVWGGRSSSGLDCSALIQLALQAAGAVCPRDSDMQEQALGTTLADGATPGRGDLIFWRRHVGIMLDATTLLHANAHHMAVATEPLGPAVSRIMATGGGAVTRRVRLDGNDTNG